nr:ATP synthase subunit 8 [Ceratosoma sp. HG0001]
MPQLSPMLGFLMFITVLLSYVVLLCGLSKKVPFINQTKLTKSSSKSLYYFK